MVLFFRLRKVILANPSSHSRHLPANPQLLQLLGHSGGGQENTSSV